MIVQDGVGVPGSEPIQGCRGHFQTGQPPTCASRAAARFLSPSMRVSVAPQGSPRVSGVSVTRSSAAAWKTKKGGVLWYGSAVGWVGRRSGKVHRTCGAARVGVPGCEGLQR